MLKKYVAIGCICLAVLAIGAVVLYMTSKPSGVFNDSKAKNASSLIDASTLNSLDNKSTSLISKSHLANGLAPPTNKWYSSMLLNDEPKPGFNMPNSILLRNDGFELGLPTITTSSDGIYGPHVNGIQLSIKDATTFKLTRYDELTITLTYYDASASELFTVTFASGSPYGFIQAKRNIQISLKGGEAQNDSGDETVFKNGESWYGAKASNGEIGTTVNLQKNDQLAVFSASKQADIAGLAEAAKYPIVSGEVRYESRGDSIRTTLMYKTKGNGQTLLVHMPHQVSAKTRPVSIYPSIYGDLSAYRSSEIEYSQPRQKLTWSLNLHDASANEKSAVVTQLKTDIAESTFDKKDTYFGGKQLQRLGQLVMVADSLGETKLRDEALGKLTQTLTAWFDSDTEKSFYYDDTAKAIIGREASFGSDKELNDHHFHYGYFIYAASVVAKFNEDFLNKYKSEVNLLVADVANYNSGEALPLRRNFDAYAGHSWASGSANYADGNNQESSSEAVNAWTGVGLWAYVTKNEVLKNESNWLLANEEAATKAYWLSQPESSTYTSPLVSINWGGKREYKTFFSNEPNAKLAVQLLPLNPTIKTYASKLPESVFEGTSINKQYGDYILMAKSDKSEFNAAKSFPEGLIDDGNSKSYMMAYVLSK